MIPSICEAQEGRKIAFRTLCLEQVKGIDKVVIPGKTPSEVATIELFTDVSPVVESVFTTADAMFFIEKPPGPDGKPVREIVGKGALGKSERQLFLFIPGDGKEGSLPYSVRCYDDDTKSFPMGNVRAINLAPVAIRFSLSGEITPQIPPSKFAQFPHSKKINDYNMYPVLIQFLSGNGEWINGQSVSWKSTNLRRDIVVTSVDERFKQPMVRTYTDFPPWMEAPVTPRSVP